MVNGITLPMEHELISITKILFDENSFPIDLLNATHHLKEKLESWADLPVEVAQTFSFQSDWYLETALSSGKALSPYEAGLCLTEYARTTIFVRGIRQAIKDTLSKFSHRPLQILCAGTGPYEPLALCQMPYFSPDDIQFTFLDIHKTSLQCLQRTVETLDYEKYVSSYIEDDAVSYTPPNGKTYDVIISEVMQRALGKEPQVAVTENLNDYLRPNGIFIPEQVDVSFCLIDPQKEFKTITETTAEKDLYFRKRYARKHLMKFRGDELPIFTKDGIINLPDIALPQSIRDGLEPNFTTEIKVYDRFVLDEYACSLTLPQKVDLPFDVSPGMKLSAWFEKGENPGIKLKKR